MRRLSLTAGLATLACAAGLLVGALRVAQDSNPHHLPDDVLRKVYHANAERVLAGVI